MTVEEFINRLDDGVTALEKIAEALDGSLPAAPQAASSWQKISYEMPMDDYEIANLREGLMTLRRLGLDTGDWLGQLLYKLGARAAERQPNLLMPDQVLRAKSRMQ